MLKGLLCWFRLFYHIVILQRNLVTDTRWPQFDGHKWIILRHGEWIETQKPIMIMDTTTLEVKGI